MTALITEGLFRVDGDRAVVFASRKRSSGVIKFPAERPELFDGAPEIQGDIESIELSTEGTLYTYTTQEFPPPLPYIQGQPRSEGLPALRCGLRRVGRRCARGVADHRRDPWPTENRSAAQVDHDHTGDLRRKVVGDLCLPPRGLGSTEWTDGASCRSGPLSAGPARRPVVEQRPSPGIHDGTFDLLLGELLESRFRGEADTITPWRTTGVGTCPRSSVARSSASNSWNA